MRMIARSTVIMLTVTVVIVMGMSAPVIPMAMLVMHRMLDMLRL